MRARGASAGAYVLIGIGASLYVAARTTGAGWLVVLMCMLAGVLALATAWPRVALGRVRAGATGPRDAVAGDIAQFTVAVTRPGLGVRLRSIEPPGEWSAALGPEPVPVVVTPDRRGVLTEIVLEISSAAPFGLVWWRRRMRVPLAREVEVAPRRVAIDMPVITAGTVGGDAMTASGARGDRIRSVREHVHGDPMRLVHWPASARRGALVVKELEEPERPRVSVVVDLRGTPTATEEAAERAMGVICAALDAGLEVVAHTAEASGGRSAVVSSPREAGRRLARAVAAAPPVPDPGDGRVVRVTARGGRQ